MYFEDRDYDLKRSLAYIMQKRLVSKRNEVEVTVNKEQGKIELRFTGFPGIMLSVSNKSDQSMLDDFLCYVVENDKEYKQAMSLKKGIAWLIDKDVIYKLLEPKWD